MKNKYVKLTMIFLGTILTAVLIYLGLNMETKQVYSMKVDHFEESLVELEAEQEFLDEEISKLYVDNEQTYIIKSFKEERIGEIEESVETFNENLANVNKLLYELNSRDQKKYTKQMNAKDINDSVERYYIHIEDLKVKKELTDLMNSLFSTTYMEEAEIDRDVYIATDLNTKKFEKVATRTNNRIKEAATLSIEEYVNAVKDGLEIAKKQLGDLNQAIALRDELFNANDFLVETDNEKIKEFRLAVEKIENPEIQATFTEYLRVAEAYESEELEDELEDIDEFDVNESVEQEESNYQRPPSTGSSSGSSSGGSSSESTSGSSSGSSNNHSNSESDDEMPDSSNDESSDESLEESNDESSEDSSNSSDNESNDQSTNEDSTEDSIENSSEDSIDESLEVPAD